MTYKDVKRQLDSTSKTGVNNRSRQTRHGKWGKSQVALYSTGKKSSKIPKKLFLHIISHLLVC